MVDNHSERNEYLEQQIKTQEKHLKELTHEFHKTQDVRPTRKEGLGWALASVLW